MKTHRGSRGKTPLILNLSTRLHSPTAIPLGKNRFTNLIEGWVSPRAALDVLEKRKIFCPYRD